MWILLPLPKEGWVGADHGIFTLLETNSTQLQVDGWKMLENKPFLLGEGSFSGPWCIHPQKPAKKRAILDSQWFSHIAIISWLSPLFRAGFPHGISAGFPSILRCWVDGNRTFESCCLTDGSWLIVVTFCVIFDDCIYRYEIYLHLAT